MCRLSSWCVDPLRKVAVLVGLCGKSVKLVVLCGKLAVTPTNTPRLSVFGYNKFRCTYRMCFLCLR